MIISISDRRLADTRYVEWSACGRHGRVRKTRLRMCCLACGGALCMGVIIYRAATRRHSAADIVIDVMASLLALASPSW